MVNITNDAWFGATSEPYEHLALAVYRAVEHRVELVRCGQHRRIGIYRCSGSVYQKGPSVDPQLQPDAKPVTLLGDMALLPPGGLYQRLGEAFGLAVLTIVILLGALSRQRQDRRYGLGLSFFGSATLHLAAVGAGLLLPAGTSALYAVLLHRGENALPESVAFAANWQLLLALALAWRAWWLCRTAADGAGASAGADWCDLRDDRAAGDVVWSHGRQHRRCRDCFWIVRAVVADRGQIDARAWPDHKTKQSQRRCKINALSGVCRFGYGFHHFSHACPNLQLQVFVSSGE